MPEKYILWRVDVTGFGGICLYPKEPFGDSFVYNQTKKHAREVCKRGTYGRWGGAGGTHVEIPRSITAEQARDLRKRVLKDVVGRAHDLAKVQGALEGVEEAESALDRVRRALIGEID